MGQLVLDYFMLFFGTTIVGGIALGAILFRFRRSRCPHNIDCPLIATCTCE